MDATSDETVLRVLAALREKGDLQALRSGAVRGETERVLARLEPVARRVCRSYLKYHRPELVDELVQQTLEVVWRKLPGVEATDGQSLERWVRGVALNVCRNNRRARRELLTEDGVFDVTDPRVSILGGLQCAERDEVVRRAILALDASEQEGVYHRYLQDLSQEEIAELVGLGSADEVRVLLQRARRHLRAHIAEQLVLLGHSISFVQAEHER